jgi:nitrogen regulatory protein P-II 1
MKLVVAIVPPEVLDNVHRAVAPFGAILLSASQVVHGGRQSGRTEIYRGREVRVRRPLLRLEIATDEENAESVIQAILRCGLVEDGTDAGDGTVIVMELAGTLRTRGSEAVSTRS